MVALPILICTCVSVQAQVTIVVEAPPPEAGAARRISPLLFGTQFAYYNGGSLKAVRDPASWERLKLLKPTLLRFPGGTPAYHYRWFDPRRSYAPDWANAERKLTTEEFIGLCEELDAEPLLQLNTMMLEGKPRGHIRAAHDYLNPKSTEDLARGAEAMGAAWVRSVAGAGRKVPHLWQIGNEDWTYYRAGEYAEAVPIYAAAVRRVTPDARVIAVGLGPEKVGPFDPTWLSEDQRPPWWGERMNLTNERDDWNAALAALPHGTFDLVSLHLYVGGEGEDTVEHYRSLLGNLERSFEEPLDRAYKRFADAGHAEARLAVTEWSADFGSAVEAGGSMDGFYYTQANGLATAEAIGRLVERSPWVEIGVHHSLFSMGTVWLWPEGRLVDGARPLEHPNWKAMALWRNHLREGLADVDVQGSATVSTPRGALPSIGAWAMADDGGCSLIVTNRDPSKAARLRLELRGSLLDEAAPVAELLSGPGPPATNWEYDKTGNYPVDTRPVQLRSANDRQWRMELPALSVLGVEWRNSKAD